MKVKANVTLFRVFKTSASLICGEAEGRGPRGHTHHSACNNHETAAVRITA